MKKLFAVLWLSAALALMAGCRTAPVYNVENAPIVTATGKSLTEQQVRQAIVTAGAGLGWTMSEVAPGHMVATLKIRDHLAKADVNYSPKAFSIAYKDSVNLKYDGTQIHSNYNGWIHNLQNAITAALSAY